MAGAMVVLLLIAPPASASLLVETHEGATFSIHTHGSTTLAAPRNATIEGHSGGYLIDWQAPTPPAGHELSGYAVYRVPAPGTDGTVEVTELGPRWSVFFDRPDEGTYVYFVTALFGGASESIPSDPVSTLDVSEDSQASASGGSTGEAGSTSAGGWRNYPHCNVVGISPSPPYYDVHLSCLFPI
ncbi:MAG TPA: hypothetical protein VHI93_06570 [Candidatus Thermoplasmatota archaeon]|nr:hypothetical protein [Candidatus Thermoplasmatota archaeon]